MWLLSNFFFMLGCYPILLNIEINIRVVQIIPLEFISKKNYPTRSLLFQDPIKSLDPKKHDKPMTPFAKN